MSIKMEHAVSELFVLGQKTGQIVSFVNEAREGPDHMLMVTHQWWAEVSSVKSILKLY